MANTNVGRGRILTVIFSCLIGLMAGLIYTWSIWVGPITAEYGWDTDAVALMGNVMLATFVFGVTKDSCSFDVDHSSTGFVGTESFST